MNRESVQKTEGVDRSESKFEEDTSQHPYFRSRNSDYKYRCLSLSRRSCSWPCLVAVGSTEGTWHPLETTGRTRSCATRPSSSPTWLHRWSAWRSTRSSRSCSGGEGVQQGQMGTPGTVCKKAHQTLQVAVLCLKPDLLQEAVQLFRNVYVCTGPLYLPHMEGDGKMYVKYQVGQFSQIIFLIPVFILSAGDWAIKCVCADTLLQGWNVNKYVFSNTWSFRRFIEVMLQLPIFQFWVCQISSELIDKLRRYAQFRQPLEKSTTNLNIKKEVKGNIFVGEFKVLFTKKH